MTKKLLVSTVCVVLIVLAAFISVRVFFSPMPIIPSETDISILFVQRRAGFGAMPETIVTNTFGTENFSNIDLDKFIDILSRYYVRRTFRNPYPTNEDLWSVRFMRGTNHRSIAIGGETNVLYRTASDTIFYEIINWESLLEELEMLFHSTAVMSCPGTKAAFL